MNEIDCVVVNDMDLTEAKEYRKTATVRAMQMGYPFRVTMREGVMMGEAGDWLCVGVEGARWPIKASIFAKSYERVKP